MAAQNPQTATNSQKFWLDGLPTNVLAKSSPNDEGTNKYWFDGAVGLNWQGAVGLLPPSATRPKVQAIWWN